MDSLPNSLPKASPLELVMPAAAFDKHAVTTHRFASHEAPEAVLAPMRERWRNQGVPVVEARSGDWLMLSVRSGQGIETVQVRATASGTEGLRSRWTPLRDAQVSAPAAAHLLEWLPSSSRLLRRIDHHDPGRKAATLVALVEASPSAAASHLRSSAQAAGFVADPASGMPAQRAAWYRGGDAASASGEALALRRGGETVVATVSAHRGATAVVMHWSQAQ
jgi:hypothetical protein